VFAFAVLVGGIILASAYVAIPETRSVDRPTQTNIFRNSFELLGHIRFSSFVLQTGFSTGTFLTLATASASFMKEALERPSVEFGLFFVIFPIGFLSGSFISTRLTGRVVPETMVMTGATLSLAAVIVQSSFLLTGHLSPLVLFIPGFFITFAQGIALPFGQAAAMAVNPKLVGTAAGLGVFMQNFGGAAFPQLYGILSNGTTAPLVITTAISAMLSLISAAIPFVMMRQRLRAGSP
jgi:DHA1 family bicyclomycin/chloramphenicol resistance-like MFS transporter